MVEEAYEKADAMPLMPAFQASFAAFPRAGYCILL